VQKTKVSPQRRKARKGILCVLCASAVKLELLSYQGGRVVAKRIVSEKHG
jgi:hypothetical protein